MRLEVTEGNLDPFLYMSRADSGERLLSLSADAPLSPDTNVGLPKITVKNLPIETTGRYLITATRVGGPNGRSTGTYRLSLEPGMANVVEATNQDARIYENEVVSGQLLAGQKDAWYFEAVAGNQVTILAQNVTADSSARPDGTRFVKLRSGFSGNTVPIYSERTTGSSRVASLPLGTIVELIGEPTAVGTSSWVEVRLTDGRAGFMGASNVGEDASGLQVSLFGFLEDEWEMMAENQALDQVRVANQQLAAASQFAIVIVGNQNLTYELTLSGAGGSRPEAPCPEPPPQCPGLTPDGIAARNISNEIPESGSLSNTTPLAVFQFIALEGNLVTINMQRTGGDLDTFLGLLNDAGDVLIRVDGFDPTSAEIEEFEIEDNACYFVFASRNDVSAGTTTGTFVVTVSGIPEEETEIVPEPPTDLEFGGDITVGAAVRGTITAEKTQIIFRFRSEGGGTFRATAVRDSGDLQPALILWDAQYNEIDSVTASFAGNTSNPLTIEAEPGVYYFIIVQREGAETGSTVGDFTLTVSSS